MSGNKSDDRLLSEKGYSILKKLGEGAHGNAFLATYKQNDGKKIKLYCKVIDGKKVPLYEYFNKFFPREIEVLKKINHRRLINVHSLIEQRAHLRFYMFMQYAENGDLHSFIKKNGRAKENQARPWFYQLIDGVEYLHDNKICHRDLRCENIYLNKAHIIKIGDFKYSKFWKPKDKLAETFGIPGSTGYSAPEIIKGTPYDPMRSDLWSMGVVLYFVISKILPFDTTNLKTMHEKQMAKEWSFPKKTANRISENLSNYVKLLLEPDPSKRMNLKQMYENIWIQERITLVEDRRGPEFAASARRPPGGYVPSPSRGDTPPGKYQRDEKL